MPTEDGLQGLASPRWGGPGVVVGMLVLLGGLGVLGAFAWRRRRADVQDGVLGRALLRRDRTRR